MIMIWSACAATSISPSPAASAIGQRGATCYLNLCCVQRAAPGAVLPIALKGLGEVKAAIRAHREVRRLMVGSRWMEHELVMNGLDPGRVAIVPPIPAALADARPVPPSREPEVLFVGR
jgi:hypothetical protein